MIIRRFCCKYTIAAGVQLIGYLNILLILGILILYSTTKVYQYMALAALPLVNLLWFGQMIKHDSTRHRRRFYIQSIITYCITDLIQVY